MVAFVERQPLFSRAFHKGSHNSHAGAVHSFEATRGGPAWLQRSERNRTYRDAGRNPILLNDSLQTMAAAALRLRSKPAALAPTEANYFSVSAHFCGAKHDRVLANPPSNSYWPATSMLITSSTPQPSQSTAPDPTLIATAVQSCGVQKSGLQLLR